MIIIHRKMLHNRIKAQLIQPKLSDSWHLAHQHKNILTSTDKKVKTQGISRSAIFSL